MVVCGCSLVIVVTVEGIVVRDVRVVHDVVDVVIVGRDTHVRLGWEQYVHTGGPGHDDVVVLDVVSSWWCRGCLHVSIIPSNLGVYTTRAEKTLVSLYPHIDINVRLRRR